MTTRHGDSVSPDVLQVADDPLAPAPRECAEQATQPRRAFLTGTLAVLPAAVLASACAGEDEPLEDVQPVREEALASVCPERSAVERRRQRWRRWVDLHMGEENAHDLTGVMETFGEHAEMIFNGMPFLDESSIAAGHVLFGMSQDPGALTDTQVVPQRTTYTDDEVLVEGHVIANHVGDVMGFLGRGQRVSLPYSAFYRFDDQGKLVSERIVMNWQPLAAPA